MSGGKGQDPEQTQKRVMVRHVAEVYLSHKMYLKNAGNERRGRSLDKLVFQCYYDALLTLIKPFSISETLNVARAGV